MFGSFFRARDGAFAIMLALLLPVLLLAVGLAVDFAHMVSAKSRLQSAADAGALAASRENLSEAQREAAFNKYLEANFSGRDMTITRADIAIEDGINHLTVSSHVTADVDFYFMHHLGVRQISAVASTFRSVTSMEIAVVLDNTGSMGAGGITALKRASHALVNEVDNARAPGQEVRMSLVPFVTAVNIMTEGFDPAWIDHSGRSLYNGWNFLDSDLRHERRSGVRRERLPRRFGSNSHGSQNQNICSGSNRARCTRADSYPHHMRLFEQSSTRWKGCVEARPYPLNFNMDPPDPGKPETLFVPYFAPSEPAPIRTDNGGDEGHLFNNAWLNEEVEGSQAERQRSTLKYIDPPAKRVYEGGRRTVGPNRACPTPITPLTTDLRKVRDGIDAMDFWNGSGTNIAEGLAWGWRMLSPGEPFAQAGNFNPEERKKFLVLMTDGRNVSFGASGESINKSDYGSYGFLDSGRIDGATSQGNAERALNNWTLDMCGRMKRQEIEIFTVVYNETAQSVQDMFRTCASRAENFYMTNNTAGLESAFASIGRQMSALRLTH